MSNQKILILCLFATLILTGCEKAHSADPEKGYATNFAMSATEYNIFLNEEISVMENVLMTRMSMSQSIAGNAYDYEKEISSTEESISKVKSIEDEVTTTMPATNYETDRQNILDLIEDSKIALDGYLDALKNKDVSKIKSSTVELKTCYVALSGEANISYQ